MSRKPFLLYLVNKHTILYLSTFALIHTTSENKKVGCKCTMMITTQTIDGDNIFTWKLKSEKPRGGGGKITIIQRFTGNTGIDWCVLN